MQPAAALTPGPATGSARGPELELPRIDHLGIDLLVPSRLECWRAFVRPFLGLGAFALACYAELWWLTPFIVFLIFVAIVTTAHDAVHGALGLGPRATHWALFVLGAVLLESGHAYRISHTRHHSTFPGPDDPEGDPARMSFWGAVLHGPIFLPRLWFWAWNKKPGDRSWLAAEAGWALLIVALGVVLLPVSSAVLLYASLVIMGGWSYSLLTVHLPHRNYGPTPLTQTHTLRGWLLPKLFLELTYHLEHHLYPDVPSWSLPELSRRLDPILLAHGVRPRRVF